MKPLRSITGTNALGSTRPRVGCRQRTSASRPTILPVWVLHWGCQYSVNSWFLRACLLYTSATWQIAEGDVISPIPQYVPGFNGPDANTEEYPLQITGYHTKAHTHSSYANNQIIQDAHHHNVWINPLDVYKRQGP